MVTIGIDTHKRSHTLVVVDGNGRQLSTKSVAATEAGHLEALRWSQQWPERTWAIEDCRALSRRLEKDLLRAGEQIVRVPPKLMAALRAGARTQGKSDPIDALAVARAALREPDLPVAHLDGPEREVRLLVDHRDDLVAERTRAQNRLRWHLHELDPEFAPPLRSLDRTRVLDEIDRRLEGLDGVVVAISVELVATIRQLTARINDLERQLAKRVAPLAPRLLDLFGCGALTAAKVVGETAGMRRFRSRSAYAMHNGTAPVPVWSANNQRHRLNRGGNRQLNVALHRIAITQLRRPGRSRDYLEQRMARGDTRTEALRALRRRISDEVYRRLCADEVTCGLSAGRAVESAAA